jgi:transposase
MPVGYEVFAGNRHDATTLEEMIEHIEKLHGRGQRIWVLDRGMVSEENVEFLKQGQRRYIVGTPKSMLKRYERELLAEDWRPVHAGLEVRLCPAQHGAEVFILCRSAQRQQKEQAMHARFESASKRGCSRSRPPVPNANRIRS